VIQPGVTSTDDVKWWYRERIAELKLDAWFHPSVDVTRPDPSENEAARSFAAQTTPEANIIKPGDLAHIDFGITYLRLNTDTQQNAYLLRPGETAPPAGLVEAFKKGNRLQDILTSNFKEGRTGNEILQLTREQAMAEGLTPSIYSHPIGYHGHAAGTSIGMWDNQKHVPTGEHPLHENTCYAIELNAREKIPEWGNKEIRVMLEEDAVFKNGQVHYIDGRQKKLMLIPRQSPNVQ
jgi:Xaa-Pro aminopeptidase